MNQTLVMLLVALAVGSAVLGLYSLLSDLVLHDRDRLNTRVSEEFRRQQREQVRKSSSFKNLAQLAVEAAEPNQPRLTWTQRLTMFLDQSGLPWRPRGLLLRMGGAGLLSGLGAGLLRRDLLIGILLGLVATALPLVYVVYKRRTRLEKLLTQLPEAMDLMARVIRAGQSMMQALQVVGDEFERPIAVEFSYAYEQMNLGLPYEIALRDLADRTGVLEVKILVVALLVQQQTGGNLTNLLESLAGVIRERLRMRGKVQALTAEGRMQAGVLLALPPVVFVVMILANRPYADRLLQHPWLLVGTVVSMCIGALWIRRIVRFDF